MNKTHSFLSLNVENHLHRRPKSWLSPAEMTATSFGIPTKKSQAKSIHSTSFEDLIGKRLLPQEGNWDRFDTSSVIKNFVGMLNFYFLGQIRSLRVFFREGGGGSLILLTQLI